MKTFIKLTLIPCLIFIFASCSDEKDNITGVVEDAWDAIEDSIESSAEEALNDFAQNPEKLYSGECETEFMSLGDVFTLRIPINYETRAAVSLLFGSDAGEFLSLVDNANRNSKSKSDVKKLIEKHFNSSWAGMMTALIVLDGEFDYDFETDDWMDSSYEFDSKALYKILDEKGYFAGAHGDPLLTGNITTDRESAKEPERSGHQTIQGDAIDSKGNKYPFRVEFDIAGGKISNAIYVNSAYSTKVKFNSAEILGDKYVFRGKNGKDELELSFSAHSPYNGTLRQGNTTLEVIMNSNNLQTLADFAENLDPQYFTNQLKTYRLGSDKRMEQMFYDTGSTNIAIKGSGVIGSHNISMQGWITEDGTIHGRYHNENGINLDFNGYIKSDNSLYIQLGHDGEKSDWYLYPAASEATEGYARYEGKWGKSQKDSYVVFSEE